MIKSKLRLFGWAVGLSLALGAVGAVAAQGAPVETKAANGQLVGDEITTYDKIRDGYSYKIVYTISSTAHYLTTSISSNKGSVNSSAANAGVFLFESAGSANTWYISFLNGNTKTYIRPNNSNATVRTSTSTNGMAVTAETISSKIGLYQTISSDKWYMAANASNKTCGGYKSTSSQQYISKMIVVSTGSVAVTGVTLDKTSASLYKATADNTVTLTPTVSPSDATVKTVSWSTTNSNVATVAGGVVTAVNPGTATITVTTTDGSKTATCAITVWGATAMTISNPAQSGVKTHYLAGDDPDHTGLVATITWSDGSNTKLEDVTAKATWDDSGAVAAEDESVFFSAAYGGVNDEFELAIEVAAEAKYPESVSVSYSDTSLYVGESESVASTGYLPNDANQLNFGFSSSDSTVLSVDSDGAVHALKAGSATITYFSDYDGKRDTVKATVNFTVENVPPTGITLSASSGSISEDAEGTLDFTVTVEGSPTIPGYNVSVTDSTIVTASKSGDTVSLTPKKAGSTTVVITSIATPVQSATYTVTVTAVPKYTLVTDITQLTIGNKVIFTNEDSDEAMPNWTTGNNIKSVSVSEESTGVVKKTSAFAAYTIGADQNGYTFKDENNKFLYAASTTSNYLKVRDALSNDNWDHWSIGINAETGIASVSSVGNTSRGVMQLNPNNGTPMFACYSDASYEDIKLYVLNTIPSAADKVETFSQLYMHKGDVPTSKIDGNKCVTENWFTTAKDAIDGDWSSIAADFAASGDMWTRFVNWGAAQTPKVVITYDNGIKYNANYLAGRLITENKGGKIAMIAAFAGVGALAVGGMVFLRKRKEF